MVRINFLKVTVIVIMLSITGCASGISDDTIKSQVTNYLTVLRLPGLMSDIAFSEFFEVSNIVVKDKLIKEKECVVVCNITSKVKKKYDGNSSVTMAYYFVAGGGPGNVGESKSNDVKFMFEKYEKGWKIKEHIAK